MPRQPTRQHRNRPFFGPVIRTHDRFQAFSRGNPIRQITGGVAHLTQHQMQHFMSDNFQPVGVAFDLRLDPDRSAEIRRIDRC